MKGKKVALYGLLIALAFIFSYIEMLIPLPLPTGVKLGAANIVVLIALYLLGAKAAFAISVVRMILSGLAFGVGTLPYSLAGGLLSLGVMVLLKKSGKFGTAGVSVAGGLAHNIGQILVAMALLGENVAYYFPVLFAGGLIAGILVGLISSLVLSKLRGYIKE